MRQRISVGVDLLIVECYCSADSVQCLAVRKSPSGAKPSVVLFLLHHVTCGSSGFPFPEPDVASSDATNMECTFYADGESYVINGKKWWSSGESFSSSTAIDPVRPHSGFRKQAAALLPRSTRLEFL